MTAGYWNFNGFPAFIKESARQSPLRLSEMAGATFLRHILPMCAHFERAQMPALAYLKRLLARLEWDDIVAQQCASLPVSVFPGSTVVVMINDDHGRLALARWGLLPQWVTHPKPRDLLFNARAETLSRKPSFRRLFTTNRCVLLGQSFYEWSAVAGARKKQQWQIRLRSGQPMIFAGLWERLLEQEKSQSGPALACTMITTTPNELMSSIHNRMPALLRPADVGRWLAAKRGELDDWQSLLTAYPADEMEAIPVSNP